MNASTSHAPASWGRRLIPSLIDQIAVEHPSRPFISVPSSFEPRDGFRDINYKVFSDAVNRCAWWLEEKFGKGLNFATLTYLSHGRDIMYLILVLGATKAGYKVCTPCLL